MNKSQQVEYLELLDAGIARNNELKLSRLYEALYPWQRKFIRATSENEACMLMASNQSGKSRTGCIIDSYHLTGDYPEDWEGHTFDHPPVVWLLGYSGVKTRDLLQHKIFGRIKNGQLAGGYIPASRIIDYKSMSSVSGACSEVRVRHKSGGISICQFWSYSQGQHALMGDVVDFYHIDEEPEDSEIYPQVVTRTLNGDRGQGGRGILTFTPENGKTELVCQFMDEPESGMYLQGATWAECPHMTPEKQEKFLSKYPAYQRDMRSKGVPLMGAGLIFTVDENSLKIDPFPVPDYWFVLNGMDFGWDHPQAHIQLVEDRDNDVIYITNAWKAPKKQPYEAWHIVKPWAEDIPTAWPQDGLQHKQQMGNRDAEQQKALYEAEGWWMLPDKATWPDGSNGVWTGIIELLDRMQTGRLKIFSNLFDLFEEIREYHTKVTPTGDVQIVKVKDDLVDALRYAYMMRRHAIRIMDIDMEETGYQRPLETAGHYDNF